MTTTMGRPVGSVTEEQKRQFGQMAREKRYTTMQKSKSKNRPTEWTQAQIEAHAGNKPTTLQMITFNASLPALNEGEKPKHNNEHRVKQFLVNLGALILFRKDLPDIPTLCKNFHKDFDAQVDDEKLYFALNSYAHNFLEIDKTQKFPMFLLDKFYNNRKEQIESLRKEAVKDLCKILNGDKVECQT